METNKTIKSKMFLAKQAPSSTSLIATDSLPEHLRGIDPTTEESEKGYFNFSVISNQINTIELLDLSAMGHRRLLIKIDNDQYNYKWLIP